VPDDSSQEEPGLNVAPGSEELRITLPVGLSPATVIEQVEELPTVIGEVQDTKVTLGLVVAVIVVVLVEVVVTLDVSVVVEVAIEVVVTLDVSVVVEVAIEVVVTLDVSVVVEVAIEVVLEAEPESCVEDSCELVVVDEVLGGGGKDGTVLVVCNGFTP
jgi:hypothetical protein